MDIYTEDFIWGVIFLWEDYLFIKRAKKDKAFILLEIVGDILNR